ncbi:unnamed protein product [Fraxinus pennsylvanica]|uniref:Uncharacterized protein n=1 Tax=Fraxinus pennsylvanica TaxID=56036 RepID=A0AAD2A2F7_9LAMI|nr:unnamed protein product [Fraxinus pennsylvanica]
MALCWIWYKQTWQFFTFSFPPGKIHLCSVITEVIVSAIQMASLMGGTGGNKDAVDKLENATTHGGGGVDKPRVKSTNNTDCSTEGAVTDIQKKKKKKKRVKRYFFLTFYCLQIQIVQLISGVIVRVLAMGSYGGIFQEMEVYDEDFVVWNSPAWMFGVRQQRGLESLLYHNRNARVVVL